MLLGSEVRGDFGVVCSGDNLAFLDTYHPGNNAMITTMNNTKISTF
jgi:hypothetical protein